MSRVIMTWCRDRDNVMWRW